jgi:uncharacterized protein (TIGR04255 family)
MRYRRAFRPEFAKAALRHFPVSEPAKQLFAGAVKLGEAGAVVVQQTESTEWNYYGKDREKRLAIAPQVLLVTYSKYTTYETLKGEFMNVASALFATYPETTSSRIGVRYINHVTEGAGGPFEWADLIDPNLLGVVTRFGQPDSVNRVFHIVEFRHDDIGVKFQFGLPNPDFPALMRKRLFVLDIDASVHGAQEQNEIPGILDRAHGRIQELFETSITDALRQSMGVVNDGE